MSDSTTSTIEELTAKVAALEAQLNESQILAQKAQTLINLVRPLYNAGLYSRFHHGNGYLCGGTLRLMRADFDTCPSQAFQDAFFDQVCDSLNALGDFIGPRLPEFPWQVDLIHAGAE